MEWPIESNCPMIVDCNYLPRRDLQKMSFGPEEKALARGLRLPRHTKQQ
jgi:hypothetical protein